LPFLLVKKPFKGYLCTMDTNTPLLIYAESTPNPATMKFVANTTLLANKSAEFSGPEEAAKDDLPGALFRFPFVKSVYLASNFVTVTKIEGIEWYEVMNEVRNFIRDFLEAGNPVITKFPEVKAAKAASSVHGGTILPDEEMDARIVEILDEYIKPAVAQDGGEIAYRGFEKGTVYVAMRGSCSGCPSSTLTLKAGIEQLLKRMVPGVEEVVAENE
jgi:NFU1 iron-sulfur cluster scaffold homolog, mitochondrial